MVPKKRRLETKDPFETMFHAQSTSSINSTLLWGSGSESFSRLNRLENPYTQMNLSRSSFLCHAVHVFENERVHESRKSGSVKKVSIYNI